MKVFDSFCDSERDVQDVDELRRFDSSDVIEQVSIRTKLRDDHDGNGGRLFRDRDSDELNYVLVSKIAK